jgi:hypothetical protein
MIHICQNHSPRALREAYPAEPGMYDSLELGIWASSPGFFGPPFFLRSALFAGFSEIPFRQGLRIQACMTGGDFYCVRRVRDDTSVS